MNVPSGKNCEPSRATVPVDENNFRWLKRRLFIAVLKPGRINKTSALRGVTNVINIAKCIISLSSRSFKIIRPFEFPLLEKESVEFP